MFGWFKKNPAQPSGPDFSAIDSRAKAEELFHWGELMVTLACALAAWVGLIASVSASDELVNPWPAEFEAEFQARAERVLKAICAKEKAAGLGGRTYFENEKRAYGFLLAHALLGDKEVAIKELQREDAQANEWHSQTAGIDYYACFTLKHQMRKYFLFSDQFDANYRRRMVEGAKAWTERDPLRRETAGDGSVVRREGARREGTLQAFVPRCRRPSGDHRASLAWRHAHRASGERDFLRLGERNRSGDDYEQVIA